MTSSLSQQDIRVLHSSYCSRVLTGRECGIIFSILIYCLRVILTSISKPTRYSPMFCLYLNNYLYQIGRFFLVYILYTNVATKILEYNFIYLQPFKVSLFVFRACKAVIKNPFLIFLRETSARLDPKLPKAHYCQKDVFL